MNVLITGANGFIGRHLCRDLALRGFRVKAVSRRRFDPIQFDPTQGAESQAEADACRERIDIEVLPEMSPATDFSSCLQGMDAVVHLAGRAHILRENAAAPLQQFRAVNVELTAQLARDARDCEVQRFVYLSSIGVMGNSTGGTPLLRSSRPAPREDYAVSKLEAERRLQQLFADDDRLVIIRPPLVYGPGAKGNFQRLMALVDRVPCLPFGAARKERSFVYVRNLCSFIARCLDPHTPGGVYLVCDDERISLRELVRMMARGLRKKRALFPMPHALLKALAACMGKRKEVHRLLAELVINNREDKSLTGWNAECRLEDGIQDMVEQYRQDAA